MAKRKPCPYAPPSSASAGTRAPTRITCRVGWAFQPILRSFAPSSTRTKCVLVRNAGTTAARVALYGTVSGTLVPYLTLMKEDAPQREHRQVARNIWLNARS